MEIDQKEAGALPHFKMLLAKLSCRTIFRCAMLHFRFLLHSSALLHDWRKGF